MSVPFELHQLEAFMVVADLLSVSQAAAQLHISQPALTRKIHNLEDALAVKLFIRGHNRLYLSPAGCSLMVDGATIMQLVQVAADCARNSTIVDR